jgi:hypothetical protein
MDDLDVAASVATATLYDRLGLAWAESGLEQPLAVAVNAYLETLRRR